MRPRPAPVLLFALALGLRAAYIFEIDDSPTFTHPPVDGVTYVKQAESIAAGNWLGRGQEPFWQPPLYPYLLGLFRLFFGGDSFFYAVRLFQALAGAGTCLLAWHLGGRLFHPGVGLAAGAAAAVYGPLIYFDGEILPASLATFLDLAGLALLLRCLRRPTAPGFLGAGALFGLASLTVPTVLGFAAGAAVFILVKAKRGATLSAPRLAFPAAFVLGVLLPILPVAVRNAAIGGDAVLISYNAGVNFYVGNNENYDESVGIRPGWDWDELLDRPRESGITRPSGRSAFFFSQSVGVHQLAPRRLPRVAGQEALPVLARRRDRAQPGDLFLAQLLGYTEPRSVEAGDRLPFRDRRSPGGPPAPCSRSAATAPRCRCSSSPCTGISVIAFFVTSRYRLPVVPLLLIHAAYAGHCLVAGLRGGNRTRGGIPRPLPRPAAAGVELPGRRHGSRRGRGHPLQSRGGAHAGAGRPGGEEGVRARRRPRPHSLAGLVQPRYDFRHREGSGSGDPDIRTRSGSPPRPRRRMGQPGSRAQAGRRPRGGAGRHT